MSPRLGANRDILRQTLAEQASALSLLRSPSPGWKARDWLAEYVEWTTRAAGALRGQVAAVDIDRLVFTPRYHALVSKVGMLYPDLENSGLVHLLTAELDDRNSAFGEAHQALQRRIAHWSVKGTFVVFDTNVYLHQPRELADMDIRALLEAPASDPVHLLVPMAVVDELDTLKQSTKSDVRGRARRATRLLHTVLSAAPTQPAALHPDDPSITLELLPDPPGHLRLPITDDEIIDRTGAAQVLAGRPITLVTGDTGQALRAHIADLAVRYLPPAD